MTAPEEIAPAPEPAAQANAGDARLGELLCSALPPQGAWSDDAYLWLTDHSRRLIEFTDGSLEELPLPTSTHQAVLLFLYSVFHAYLRDTRRGLRAWGRSTAFLYSVFHAYLRERGGVVMVAPLRMRIRDGKFREPDLLLLRSRHDPRYADRYWLGADLVAEVVSADDPDRDFVQKRADYADAGVHEYWIVDPRDETVLVLGLADGVYREIGRYGRGDFVASPSLEGLVVDVAALFDAPKPAP